MPMNRVRCGATNARTVTSFTHRRKFETPRTVLVDTIVRITINNCGMGGRAPLRTPDAPTAIAAQNHSARIHLIEALARSTMLFRERYQGRDLVLITGVLVAECVDQHRVFRPDP